MIFFIPVIVKYITCSRISFSGEEAKEKGRRKVALPSFLPFYFHVCAFSIQQTRLSQSLQQDIKYMEKNLM